MAGKNIHLGNIMAALKQDTQDYTNTLNSVITKLDAVRMAIEQSTTSLNVAPSEVLKSSMGNAHKQKAIMGLQLQEVELYRFKVICTGAIRIKLNAFSNAGINTSAIFVTTTSGAHVVSGGIGTSQTNYAIDVPVSTGDIVAINARGQMTQAYSVANVTLVAGSVQIFYSQLDIVNSGGGAVVKIE